MHSRMVQRIEMFYMEEGNGICCDGDSGFSEGKLVFGR